MVVRYCQGHGKRGEHLRITCSHCGYATTEECHDSYQLERWKLICAYLRNSYHVDTGRM